jgi:hypothetical protein
MDLLLLDLYSLEVLILHSLFRFVKGFSGPIFLPLLSFSRSFFSSGNRFGPCYPDFPRVYFIFIDLPFWAKSLLFITTGWIILDLVSLSRVLSDNFAISFWVFFQEPCSLPDITPLTLLEYFLFLSICRFRRDHPCSVQRG